jgi:hypothetical protein
MEIAGYTPVESVPTLARAGEVSVAAAAVRNSAENIVGAEKVRHTNSQLEQAAKKRLEGITEVSPEVGKLASAAIETIAKATDFGATVEGWKSGASGGAAGAAEWVARGVANMKLDSWGRKVDIQTQVAQGEELNMDVMKQTAESKMPDLRDLAPEKAVGFFDKLAGKLRKDEGKHARRKDEMRERAAALRELKTTKVEVSDELRGEVTDLNEKYTATADQVRLLQEEVKRLEAVMNAGAQTVGGTPLENVTRSRPV